MNTENPNEISAYILTGYATEYEVFGTLHMPSPWSTYDEGGWLHIEFMDDAIIEDIHYFDDLFGHQVNLTPGNDFRSQIQSPQDLRTWSLQEGRLLKRPI